MTEDVERLRELSDAATPGPWRWVEKWDWTNTTEGSLVTDVPGAGLYVNVNDVIEPTGYEAEAIRMRTTDAAFIVAAVNYVRRILKESKP